VKAAKDYRQRIYEKYASCFQDTDATFDVTAAERWGRAYDTYLKDWLPARKDMAILEVACGNGRLLHFFKKRGYVNLTGVDISMEQVRLAKQVLENVVEANLLNFLDSTEKKYDVVIGLDIIEHFHKDEVLHFLESSYKVLKPDGRIILQTVNGDSPWSSSIHYSDFTHELCLSPNSLTQLLRSCGFDRIEAREQGAIPWGYSLTSSARYLLWRLIRLGLKIYNFAETGCAGCGIFTRVFTISGCKT